MSCGVRGSPYPGARLTAMQFRSVLPPTRAPLLALLSAAAFPTQAGNLTVFSGKIFVKMLFPDTVLMLQPLLSQHGLFCLRSDPQPSFSSWHVHFLLLFLHSGPSLGFPSPCAMVLGAARCWCWVLQGRESVSSPAMMLLFFSPRTPATPLHLWP